LVDTKDNIDIGMRRYVITSCIDQSEEPYVIASFLLETLSSKL